MARRKRRRGPAAVEDVLQRAARLGITPERVLNEYAKLAFSDLSRVADWGPGEDGLRIRLAKDLDPADVAAIAEIVASASTGKIYRIKLHDKPAVLGAIARHLHMLPRNADPAEDEPNKDDGEDAREFLIHELDRLASEEAETAGDPEPGGRDR